MPKLFMFHLWIQKRVYCIYISLYTFYGMITTLPFHFIVRHTHTQKTDVHIHLFVLQHRLSSKSALLSESRLHADGGEGMLFVPKSWVHSKNFIQTIIWLAKLERGWHIHFFYHLIQKNSTTQLGHNHRYQRS